MNKIYVGNLAYETSEDDLRNVFSEVGEITSVNIIIDRDNGRSKGFGFVEFASGQEANKAVDMFNGKEIGGRTIRVSIAKPKR